jgi:5,6,7,8-tetrahydromethanopterin hydro-lyase
MQLGEGFAGTGAHAAHVNTALGPRDGPVGAAWVTALASPSAGHTPFVVVVRPGLPVQPYTLFVNKATIASDLHARLTWGPAQAGVAEGVRRAMTGDDPVTDPAAIGELVLVTAVWVDPAATDAASVFEANVEATESALRLARAGGPALDAVLGAPGRPWNPFFPLDP